MKRRTSGAWRRGEGGMKPDSLFVEGHGPWGEALPVLPRVFSSRERAEKFVGGHGQELMAESPQLVEELIENIRKINRDEIPEKHYVVSERKGFFVTWAELLGEGE